MDSQKDIQIEEKVIQKNEELKGLSFLQKDPYLFFVFKKVERLVAAIYMISNFLPSEEPIKWRMRQLGVTLLSKNVFLTTGSVLEKQSAAKDTIGHLVEMSALLEIGFHAGLISQMNFDILKREFEGVLEQLNSREASFRVENPVSFEKSFFEVSKETSAFSEKGAELNTSRTVTSGYEVRHENRVKAEERKLEGEMSNKGQIKDIPLASLNGFDKKAPVKAREVFPKNNRREAILNIFRKSKGEGLSIKDISLIIRDCSEKTIQRELLDMVSEGILNKEGERRWSRYGLIQR